MTNSESQTRSEEMQEKAERTARQIVMICYPHINVVAREQYALKIVRETNLPALLTAEAELSHIDGALARRPALANEPDRCAKIEKAINTAKQADQLRVELESTNMALKASCQCAEQFKKERDGLLKKQYNPPTQAIHLERDRLESELAQLRRNVGTLYEWLRGNTSLTGKQKEAANYIFEQLDKGAKEDSDLRAELAVQGRNAVSLFDECKKLQAELATAKAEPAYANDAADKGEAGRKLGTALEEALKENAALRDVAAGAIPALRASRDAISGYKVCYGLNDNSVMGRAKKKCEDALRTLAEKGVVL